MSASPVTSLPRPPAERTFVVAVGLLSVAAVAQLIAVVVALAPQAGLDKLGRSLAAPSNAVPSDATAAQPVSGAALQEAQSFLSEAQQFHAQKNLEGALQATKEADRVLPNSPTVLMALARAHMDIGQVPEATAVLQKIVALPVSSDPQEAGFRSDAVKALAQLSGASAPAAPAKDSPAMRDEVGIPIGSVMGIVTADLVDGAPGQKNLRVATKAASSQKIDSQKFVATVDFYEQDDSGQIQHADAQMTEWLSLPATWTGEPEIFQTKYRMPLADRGDLPPLQYYGYVVAIYYNGELQDQRADPVALLDKFPPPVHKDSATE